MTKIVITGLSGAGKTKLTNQLSRLGYNTVQESAREVRGKVEDGYHSQREMFMRQMDKERDHEGTVIYDRGFPDILGFADYLDASFPFTLGYHYDAVISLEFLPNASYRNRLERNAKQASYIYKNYVLPYYKQQYPEKPDIYRFTNNKNLFNRVKKIIDKYV